MYLHVKWLLLAVIQDIWMCSFMVSMIKKIIKLFIISIALEFFKVEILIIYQIVNYVLLKNIVPFELKQYNT